MEKPILCGLCFKNEGLRRGAAKLGSCTSEACPRCGKHDGAKLDRTAATELFNDFYCRGSQASAYLPQVFVDGMTTDRDIQFEASAQTDYELLEKLLGKAIRRNTPNTVTLGFTEIRSMIEKTLGLDPLSASEETAERLRECLRKLLATSSEYQFREDQTIYRARVSPMRPTDSTEFDSPPVEKAVANRISGAGDRVLCASANIETCLFEVRPHIDALIHHKVFVASLRPTHALKLIDFTAGNENPRCAEAAPWLSANVTLRAFFQANQNSYHLTQLLSGLANSRGYDGVIYPSAMECVAGARGAWKNVAIFGAPISDGKLIVASINRVLVRKVTNDFDLGPAWDDGEEGGHLAPFLKGWINRANR